MWTCSILTAYVLVASNIVRSPIKRFEEVHIVHNVIKFLSKALDNSHHLSRLQDFSGELKQEVDKVILPKDSLLVLIDASKLILEHLLRLSRAVQLEHGAQTFRILEKSIFSTFAAIIGSISLHLGVIAWCHPFDAWCRKEVAFLSDDICGRFSLGVVHAYVAKVTAHVN